MAELAARLQLQSEQASDADSSAAARLDRARKSLMEANGAAARGDFARAQELAESAAALITP